MHYLQKAIIYCTRNPKPNTQIQSFKTMEITKSNLQDLLLIKPKVFKDHRGFFLESYSEKTFKDNGVDITFVQDNHAMSVEKGVLRGLHFQLPPYTQTKLVRITCGAVYDVAVDLRKNSHTYGKWQGFELSAKNNNILLVPKGFAHGYCTLEENTEFLYKCDNFYTPDYESAIRWNDPDLQIDWPVDHPILSKKDAQAPFLKEFTSPF